MKKYIKEQKENFWDLFRHIKNNEPNSVCEVAHKITHGYEHRHPILFAVAIFNVFVFVVLGSVYFINSELDFINAKKISFNEPNPTILRDVESILEGYPMAEIATEIAREDREVAAFLVAIAKKESAWGKYTPKLHGRECYNYWGYRGKRERMGSGGHTCFDSPEDAVSTVALRIKRLINNGYNTPEKIVVWKCGYSCVGHSSASVDKWVRDVDVYYNKMTH
ncbi:MAG: hypothetical protein ABFQ53_00415 [Patescibacteria group bacterium]